MRAKGRTVQLNPFNILDLRQTELFGRNAIRVGAIPLEIRFVQGNVVRSARYAHICDIMDLRWVVYAH